MTTRRSVEVISKPASEPVFTAATAHELAKITYRQLDHWARQRWVEPSIDPGQGRSGRRLYAAIDIVRLDLLRHLAMSGINAALAGPAVNGVRVPEDDVRVLWGPIRSERDGSLLTVIPAGKVLERLEEGGAHVVYNPAAVRARIALLAPPAADNGSAGSDRRRRSA